jgi:hypothetical protein
MLKSRLFQRLVVMLDPFIMKIIRLLIRLHTRLMFEKYEEESSGSLDFEELLLQGENKQNH